MQHFWFRIFDRRALHIVAKFTSDPTVRIFASELDRSLRPEQIPAGLNLRPISMSVEDSSGDNIRARALEIAAIIARAAAGEVDAYDWLPKAHRLWGAEWHRILGAHWYLENVQVADFAAHVENIYAKGEIGTPDHVVIDVGRNMLGADVAKTLTSALRFPFLCNVRAQNESAVADAGFEFIRVLLRMTLGTLRLLLWRTKPESNIVAGKLGIVLVQFEASGPDRLPIGGAQDWIEYSKVDPRRVIFYFDRQDSPLNDYARQKLAARGHGWVDYSAPFYNLSHPVRSSFACLRQLLAALVLVRDRASLARWTVLLRLLPAVLWNRKFLAKNRVLAVHQGSEFIPSQMALALACRQEGVAFIWTFTSVMVFMAGWYQSGFADLILAWGDYDAGYYGAHSIDYRVMAICGLLGYDGVENGDVQCAADIRGRLFGRPKFVIAMFDSSHTERSIHQSTERCVLFYKTVFQLVRENPEWGCLIKSKSSAYDDLPITPGVQEFVTELEAVGRCVRLDISSKPSIAALAADAVACFSINSAGVMSTLICRRPTIHFDPNHLKMHPLSIFGGEGQIIFRTVESFQSAIRSLAAGDTSVGNFSKWARTIDPFQDGLGRKRSGKIMMDYLAARDKGLSLNAALARATEEHRRAYGEGFVRFREGHSELAGDAMWRHVKEKFYPNWPKGFSFSKKPDKLSE